MGSFLYPKGISTYDFPELHQHPALSRPLRVSILGNSHAASNPGVFDRFCSSMGGSVIRGTNAGIGGNTTAQMLTRMDADIPEDTDLCLVIEGTNDGNAFANSTLTLAQHVANMIQIYEKLRAKGIRYALILNPGSNSPNNTFAHLQMRLTDLVLARKLNIPVYDPYRSIMTNTTGGFVAGTNTADGLHATDSATVTVANQLVADMTSGTCASLVPVCNDDRGVHSVGAVRNSLLLTDSNSDGLADNWTKSTAGTAMLSSGSGDSVSGNWQSITATGITENCWIQLRPTLARTSPGTDEFILVFSAKYTATANCTLQIYIEWYASNDTTLLGSSNLLPVTTSSIVAYKTQRTLVAPVNAAKARFTAIIVPTSAGVFSGSVSVGEFRLISTQSVLGEI